MFRLICAGICNWGGDLVAAMGRQILAISDLPLRISDEVCKGGDTKSDLGLK